MSDTDEEMSNPDEEACIRKKRGYSRFVLEWRIENFSCWMEALHGKGIVCRQLSMILETEPALIELSLYPKGGADQCDLMDLTFGVPNVMYHEEGDINFLAPDGSILCRRRVNRDSVGGYALRKVTGPKFRDVVSKIEQSEDLHGDHLTIQFKWWMPERCWIHMKTTLDVLDTSFKFSKPSRGCFGVEPVRIASVSYNSRNGGQQQMLVTYHTVEKNLCLKTTVDDISPMYEPQVHYRLSVFDSNGVLVEHSKALLNGCKLPHTATVNLLSFESGGHCILRLKIVNGICRSHCCDYRATTFPFKTPPKGIQEIGTIPLSQDLGSLYHDKESSDFQLKCGDVAFPVHRSILCARSPVLKALLSSDMTEAASGSVVIEDVDPASLDLFLAFLYSGSFKKEVSSDVALKLYRAADKYQVPSLVKECADCLCANVRFSNVCDILELGDRHGDEQLNSVAHEFILRNFKEVTKSDEWGNYMKTNPRLLVKAITHFATNGDIGYLWH